MSNVPPYVRHRILCEDVRPDPANPRRINIHGLLQAIRPLGSSALYPLRHSFAVYLMYTGGRGTGQGQVRVESEATALPVYVGQLHAIPTDPDPLRVRAIAIHIAMCSFPQAGLYWVQFWYNGQLSHQEPLMVG